MTLEFKTTHVAEAQEKLLYQFHGAANLNAFLAALVKRAQEVEDAGVGVATLTDPNACNGAQLDLLGRVVGQLREGRDDETYRIWLQARMLLNRMSSTADEILTLLRLVVDPSRTIGFRPEYPAAFTVTVSNGVLPLGPSLARLLNEARAAGVLASFEWYETLPVFSFLGAAEGSGFGVGTFASVGRS